MRGLVTKQQHDHSLFPSQQSGIVGTQLMLPRHVYHLAQEHVTKQANKQLVWGFWRVPTLQPNMREMVLLVQATLQWHSIGEKQSSFLMLGDIFSLTFSASEEVETCLSHERCLLLPLRPPPPPPDPTPPPPPPPLLLVLPALTIHPHSSHHSIAPGEGQPDCFLHPVGDFTSILSVGELLLLLLVLWCFS